MNLLRNFPQAAPLPTKTDYKKRKESRERKRMYSSFNAKLLIFASGLTRKLNPPTK